MGPIRQITASLRLSPIRFIASVGVAYSVGWTILEPLTALLGFNPAYGPRTYLALVLASTLVAVWLNARATRVSFRPRACNFVLELKFGDIFEAQGIIAIPVNEFFDVELGQPVSERSVHGQFIKRVWGGHPEALAARLDEVLPSTSDRVPRARGRGARHPIGTTVRLDTGHGSFFLTALSHTDPDTCKAYATVQDLWSALEGLWNVARNAANGEPIALPLFGGGLSGVGLPPKHLLQVIVLSVIAASKRQEIAPRITIVLPLTLFDAVDLSGIKKEWA